MEGGHCKDCGFCDWTTYTTGHCDKIIFEGRCCPEDDPDAYIGDPASLWVTPLFGCVLFKAKED